MLDEKITRDQWSELSDDQKKIFQGELGMRFGGGRYPSYDHISGFCNVSKIDTGFRELRELEIPPRSEKLDILWKRVLEFFVNKK